jgi:membrane-associated protein
MIADLYSHLIVPTLWEIGIFIAIFAESIPFIGAFVPGGAIVLFLTGFFSKSGGLNIFVSWLVCFVASYSIDLYGYHIGKTKGKVWIGKYSKYFLIKESFIHSVGDLLKNHPIKSLVFGKFNPATRSMSPFIAGMKEIDSKEFRKISLFTSAIWVSFFLGIGYLLGKGVGYIRTLGKFAVIFSVCIFLFVYFFYLIFNMIRKKMHKKRT